MKKAAQSLDLPWLVIETIEASAARWQAPSIMPSDVAFLQYTSGSTATPNGVVVAHENLSANIEMMGKAFDNHPGTRCVSWLPVHHDMGLIGCVLMPLWQGLFTAIMPPVAFTQNPARWLRAISKYRATLTMSPNIGYELCCRQLDLDDIRQLDLSSVEVACNGAEPIRAETLDEFSRLFGPAGFRRSSFYPCYGLAEATLYVSGRHLGHTAGIMLDKASFELGRITQAETESTATHLAVSCGEPAAEQSIAIVDLDTMSECPPDRVGEIWVTGSHVTKGYWNNPDSTEAAFNSILPTRSGASFMRTGDLGFVRQGEVFVTGRLKDIIIVFGRNHYPQDIEATVERNAAIRTACSAAFALMSAGAEGIGIVAEVKMSHLRSDLARVAVAISEAVWEEHEVSVSQIAFLRPAALPKTSSGKLRRQLTRDLLLTGALPTVFRWPKQRADQPPTTDQPPSAGHAQAEPGSAGPRQTLSASTFSASTLSQRLLSLPAAAREPALLDLVIGEIGTVLDRSSASEVAADVLLRDVGLDSLKATLLRSRIAAAAGLRLPTAVLFDYPTPRALTRCLTTLLGLGGESAPTLQPPALPTSQNNQQDRSSADSVNEAYQQEIL
jgi:acyl-CoA synthetase (AMP-forming)/AMP-acid ligase II